MTKSSPTRSPDFSAVAPRYDALRPADDDWWELFDALVREADLRGRRVLEVGCGTGRVAVALAERELCRAWGVDASPEMLAAARAKSDAVRFKEARAERLPFKDGWFERVVMRVAIHLFDRPAALRECRRVLAPGGRIGIVTPDPRGFDDLWESAWFPSFAAIDRTRFPSEPQLAAELEDAGFGEVRIVPIRQQRAISRYEALEKIRGKAFSTFQLVPPAEYEAGLARAEAELPALTRYPSTWLVAVGTA